MSKQVLSAENKLELAKTEIRPKFKREKKILGAFN